jgi:hypothetical protein
MHLLGTSAHKPRICFAFIVGSSRFATLGAPQRSVKEVAKLADHSEHGRLSRGIKTALHVAKARAGKFADNAEWILGRRLTRVLGTVVLFAVVVALLLVFLNWYVAPTKPSERKDLVLALAQILAGTALLSGLYFTWRTLQVNREGQITERFTRAIDQLGATDDEGNKLFEIRLGGIYALERIARESEEDHWPIMEVLTAYVRTHAPRKHEKDDEHAYPEPDIQAIMTVIRRRFRHFHNGEPEFIDLHETDLQGANLYKAHLYGADLHGVNLSAANLSAANLAGVDLSGAHLEGANLWEAVLYGANLAGAHLEGANLRETQSLLPDQLEEAVTDERTTLLNHLRTDAGGASGSSYHVEPGDTLWWIADKKYNDGYEWPRIHQANGWILDPNRIQAGWWIWIPTW